MTGHSQEETPRCEQRGEASSAACQPTEKLDGRGGQIARSSARCEPAGRLSGCLEQAKESNDPPAQPRQAATVILLRDRDGARQARELQVLLVQRTAEARFMAGVWVFPGGSLDRAELASPHGHRLAALRELREEAGISLGRDVELVAFSRWITPEAVKTRFDTHFFLAQAPANAAVILDGQECVDHRWISPAQALRAHESGEMQLVFPTIKHLQRLSRFETVAQLLEAARKQPVQAVLPRIVLEDGSPRIVIPGETD